MLRHDDEIRFIQEVRNDQDEDNRHNDQRDKGAPFHQDRLDFELGILTGFGFLSVKHVYPRCLDNLVSRTVAMIEKYNDGIIPEIAESCDPDGDLEEIATGTASKVTEIGRAHV